MPRMICLMLLMGALATPAIAQEGDKAAYLRYCSACHGETGKGDGVVSGFMKPKPTDLTQLAKKAGGRFPLQDVIRVIDGRQTVRAHGDPDMPVWGSLIHSEQAGRDYAEAAARGRILMIADYLASIQVE